MSRQTIHRIYTEDKRRATMVRAIAKQFESFTLQSTTGYYRGKPEKSIVLEITGVNESQVKWLAARIREINRQASVLVITLNGRSKKDYRQSIVELDKTSSYSYRLSCIAASKQGFYACGCESRVK